MKATYQLTLITKRDDLSVAPAFTPALCGGPPQAVRRLEADGTLCRPDGRRYTKLAAFHEL
jgi:hypothetical protein